MDELDLTSAESKATYEEIQAWVQEKYGFHVTHLNIAKTKRKCGIIERQNYNLPKSENSRSPETPKEKEEAIIEAFKHFQMIWICWDIEKEKKSEFISVLFSFF